MRAAGLEPPVTTVRTGAVVVTFDVAAALAARGWPVGKMTGKSMEQALSRDQAGTKPGLSTHQVQVLEIAQLPKALTELMASAGRTNRTKFRDQVLRPLLDADLLEMTVPDKPRSSNQQYRTTAAGLERIDKEPR
jgi:ATP-dependent DNA helicase RecG